MSSNSEHTKYSLLDGGGVRICIEKRYITHINVQNVEKQVIVLKYHTKMSK